MASSMKMVGSVYVYEIDAQPRGEGAGYDVLGGRLARNALRVSGASG